MIKIEICILCKNELKSFSKTYYSFRKITKKIGLNFFVMDGNSTDGLINFYKKNNIKYYTQNTPGRGSAIIEAFALKKNIDALIFFSPDGNEDPHDLKKFIIEFEIKYPDLIGVRCRGCVLVDQNNNDSYNKDIPLLKQKTNGYFEEDTEYLIDNKYISEQPIYNEEEFIKKTAIHISIGIDGRSRLLHKAFNGAYTQGRHATHHLNVFPRNIGFCKESELIICWMGYSPSLIYKKRLNNFSTGRYYKYFNPDTMLFYQRQISYNLLNDEIYKKMYEKIYK